jgi:hypothetical protein
MRSQESRLQALHNDDDASGSLVIQPTIERVVIPFIYRLALRFRKRFVRLQRIINDDEVCSTAGQRTSYGSREPEAVLGRDKLLYGLFLRSEPCRKQAAIRFRHADFHWFGTARRNDLPPLQRLARGCAIADLLPLRTFPLPPTHDGLASPRHLAIPPRRPAMAVNEKSRNLYRPSRLTRAC